MANQEPPAIELPESKKVEYIWQIIHEKEKELMYNKVQEWIWLLESINPVKVGKREAEQYLAQYQRRNKEIEGQIFTFKSYAKEHNINL